MRHLSKRMHARVGAPGAYQLYRVIGDKSQRGFQILLNRFAVWLPLPATVGRSRILDAKRVLHRAKTSRQGIIGVR
jgi:hypothetical protein